MVGELLKSKTPLALALYRRFEHLALGLEGSVLASARTRIGFQRRRIFAAVNAIRDDRLDIHIVTSEPIRSTRIRRVEKLARTCHVNHFSVRSLVELDDEVPEWLRQGYEWDVGEAGDSCG